MTALSNRITKRLLGGIALCTVGVALAGVKSADAQLVYKNDFEKIDLRGWSTDSGPYLESVHVARTPGGVHPSTIFLGPYGGYATIGFSYGNETNIAGVILNLPLSGSLPAHTWIRSEWDLYIINSWDGNVNGNGPDIWQMSYTGYNLSIFTSFSNVAAEGQDYPHSATSYGSGNNAARTGASESNTLGYGGSFGDSVYHLAAEVGHTANTVAPRFHGAGLQNVLDESWGLDNITVTAYKAKVTVVPGSVQGGASALGTVILTANAPAGGYTFAVSSDNGAAIPSASVFIAGGTKTATFNINTTAVASPQLAHIKVNTPGGLVQGSLIIKP